MADILPGEFQEIAAQLIVHAVRGGDVDLTMVDGRILVEDGRLKTADMAELIAAVHSLAPGLFARRAAYLAQHGSVQWTDPATR